MDGVYITTYIYIYIYIYAYKQITDVQLEIYISVFKEIFANHYFSQGTEFVLIDKQGKIVYAPSYWDSTISTTITYIYDSNVASYSGNLLLFFFF